MLPSSHCKDDEQTEKRCGCEKDSYYVQPFHYLHSLLLIVAVDEKAFSFSYTRQSREDVRVSIIENI